MKFSEYPWSEADIVGGNAALDFVNTASDWSAEPVDRLGGAAGLADWAVVAGLLEPASAAKAKRLAKEDPKRAAKLFEDACALRASLWRIFSAVAGGEAASDEDLAALSEWNVRAARHCRIVAGGNGFRRACADEAPPLERALRQVVQSAEDLLLNGRLERLHACGGENCEWLFIDTSKNGQRRWCSMATCGNDAKVKKFRKRKKKAAA